MSQNLKKKNEKKYSRMDHVKFVEGIFLKIWNDMIYFNWP